MQVKLTAASNNYNSAKDTFDNWIATRQATEQNSQNDEVTKRTNTLDDLKAQERKATVEVDKVAQLSVDAEQNERKPQEKLGVLENGATRLSKGVCPGCERSVDLKDARNDFCPHCGIGLQNKCGACGFRKSAFNKFCNGCGTPAAVNS